jgi:hypothetical protein
MMHMRCYRHTCCGEAPLLVRMMHLRYAYEMRPARLLWRNTRLR